MRSQSSAGLSCKHKCGKTLRSASERMSGMRLNLSVRVGAALQVGCDGTGCKTEWFHYACVGLAAAPEGDWYCRDCREKRRRSLQKLKDYKRRR